MVPRFFKGGWNCIRKDKRHNGLEKLLGAQGRNRIVYDAIDLERFFEWLFF